MNQKLRGTKCRVVAAREMKNVEVFNKPAKPPMSTTYNGFLNMSFIGTKSLATVKYTHNTDLHYIVCAVRSLVVKFNCLPNFVLTMVNDIKEGTNHVLKVARKNTLRKTIDGMRREQPATSTTAVYRGAKCVIFATVLWCGRTENTARCKNLNCAPHALPREVRVWKFSTSPPFPVFLFPFTRALPSTPFQPLDSSTYSAGIF